MAHERLIPALRRLVGKELSAADQANQLLDRRVNEWLGNHRTRRYLLTWREWRLIQREKPLLVWGANQNQKETLLAHTQRYWRRCWGVSLVLVLLLLSSIGWWLSPWGQIWQVKRDIESQRGRIGNDATGRIALALYMAGGDFEQARQIADGIRAPEDKVLALGSLAVAVAKLGDTAKAATLIDQAHRTAEGIDGSGSRADALGYLAGFAATLDDASLIEPARQIAERISDPGKGPVLAHLAEAVAKLHGLEKAASLIEPIRQTAEEIGDPGAKAWALGALAVAAAKLGHIAKADALFDQGRQTAEGIGEPDAKAMALASLAVAAAKLGDTAKAASLVDQIHTIGAPGDKNWVWFWGNLAWIMAKQGAETKNAALTELARQIAEPIGHPSIKARVLAHLAVAAAKLGDPAKAATLIEQSRLAVKGIGGHDGNRRLALGALAYAYASLGDWRGARETAELNTTADDHVAALVKILRVWAERRNPALAEVGEQEE